MTNSQPSHYMYMYIIGAFSNGVCYDLQSLGYNVGHDLGVVHGPFDGLPLDLR